MTTANIPAANSTLSPLGKDEAASKTAAAMINAGDTKVKGPTKAEKEAAKAAAFAKLVEGRAADLNDAGALIINGIYEDGEHRNTPNFNCLLEPNNYSRNETWKQLAEGPEAESLLTSMADGWQVGTSPIIVVPLAWHPEMESEIIRFRDSLLSIARGFRSHIPCGRYGAPEFVYSAYEAWLTAGFNEVISRRQQMYRVIAGNRRTLTSFPAFFLREKVLKQGMPRNLPSLVAPAFVNVAGVEQTLPEAVIIRLNIIENAMRSVGLKELTNKDFIKSAAEMLAKDLWANEAKVEQTLGLKHATAQKVIGFARFVLAYPDLKILSFDKASPSGIVSMYASYLDVTMDDIASAFAFKGIASGSEAKRFITGDYNDQSKLAALIKDDKAREKAVERSKALYEFIATRKGPLMAAAAKIRADHNATPYEQGIANKLEAIATPGYVVDHKDDLLAMMYLLSYVVGNNRRDQKEAKTLSVADISVISAGLSTIPGFGGLVPTLQAIASGDLEAAKASLSDLNQYGAVMAAAMKLAGLIGNDATVEYVEKYNEITSELAKGKKAKAK